MWSFRLLCVSMTNSTQLLVVYIVVLNFYLIPSTVSAIGKIISLLPVDCSYYCFVYFLISNRTCTILFLICAISYQV